MWASRPQEASLLVGHGLRPGYLLGLLLEGGGDGQDPSKGGS